MKYKLLRLSLLSILVMLCGGHLFAADPTVTLDFTSQSNWNIPTSGTNTDLGSYTDGTYTIKLYATTNYKMNDGYLILGKTDSYLELPAFDFDVEHITVVGRSGASGAVVQNIFVGDNAVSTATTGATGNCEYDIAADNQAAGNIYKLKVTSNHNTQITKILVYKKGDYSAAALPEYSSLKELQENVSNSSTAANMTFTNVQVAHVNGSNAYLQDANGYGALVYKSNHGLEVGQILNGTSEIKFVLYQGNTEITSFTTDGLTITNGTLTPTEKGIGDITTANQNTLVTLKNVTYDATNKMFSDGTNSIEFYDKFNTGVTPEEGKTYDITGIVLLYNSKLEISPRTAEDIVEVTTEEPAGWRDIKVTLADADKWQSLVASQATVYITVAGDGTIGTTEDADKAAATLSGKWHGTSYGWSNFTASVPVEGCVKITYATHDYGNDVTVTNADGAEVAKLNNNGPKWSSDPSNVVVAYYRTNAPTTLNFSKCNYLPYFAVEAIDEADLPAEVTTYTLTFTTGEGTGIAPKAVEVNGGESVTIPKNTTLFKVGSTLTAWTDGTTNYAAGQEVTVSKDIELTPIFTENTVSFEERTAETTVTWQFGEGNGVGTLNAQGGKAVLVTQAIVNGQTIDMKMDIDATIGKLNNVGRNDKWAQCNDGTIMTIPASKGTAVSFDSYSDATGTTIGGIEAVNKAATYNGTASTLDIVAKGIEYIASVTAIYPKPEDGGDTPQPTEDVTATWDYADATVMENTMALSGTTVAGTVASIENNGIEMIVEANGATFRNNGNNIQVRTGAVFKVPVKSIGDLVTVKGYPDYSKYTIGNSTEVLTDENSYKAKASDVENGYVAVTSADGNNYYYSLSVVQYAPKEATTLDNEAVTATFPFNLGTDGQTANFGDDADYFLSSKVDYGTNLSIVGKKNPNGMAEMVMTAFQPAAKETAAAETNHITFLINPKPGFTFTPTKVSFKSTRYGTNGGGVDIAWLNPDGTTVSLDSGRIPNRNDGTNPKEGETDAKYSEYSYDITGATAAEGQCGLKLNLYNLDNNKQVGFCDIIIEGTLSGTEKDLPILASFKINGTEYAAEELFEADGTDMVGTFELSKTATMVSESNPLTDITAASGEIGTVTYESTETSCKVTIPLTAGETSVNYVLNVVQKPDFTLTYIGLDGNEIGTQTVEKDATIGTFAVDIESVTGAKEGYKARGWFKQNYVGAKYKTTDAVTGNISLYAVETEIEVSSDSKKYTFDLTDVNFDDADHEGFNSIGSGYWHDVQHGWEFHNGDKIELLVGPKATVTLSLCRYSKGNPINASNGAIIESDLVETDGGMQSIEYEGEAGTLTLTFNGTAYVHGITILNTSSVNYIREGNTFTVFAGDASSFLDALDAANGVPGSDLVTIYLPNGTYDLGQRTLTKIGRDNITIKGESQDGVVIKNRPTAEGIGVTATLLNTSKYLMLENLTLKNDYPYYDPNTGKAAADAGRAVCLQDKGNYTVCKNVTLLSYQDTYYSNNSSGQFYFVDCEIHGLVDYVCGGGDVFFENVLFYNESREMTEGKGDVTIAAPNGAKQYGYVMQNCTIDTHSAGFNFGRSWGSPSYLRWLNTTVKQPEKLASSRFTAAGMNSAADGFFEYNTMNESGESITPSSNVIKFTHSTGDKEYETIIDADEAANYTKEKVFENTPDLFKERIGYGTDGISTINVTAGQQAQEGMFNLAGQKENKSFKGIVIINGKKYVSK